MFSFSRIFYFLFLFTALFSCSGTGDGNSDEKGIPEKSILRDLKDIRHQGVLRAITIYGSTDYFLYRGQAMGYQYDMLQRLAKFLKLKLELIVATDVEDMMKKLKGGEGDIIAAGLTVTSERKSEMRFTENLYLTRQVLVQRKPKNWQQMKRHEIDNYLIRDPIQLIGDTVYVKKNSSFYSRLKNLEDEIGGRIHIKLVDADTPVEELIAMVVDGDIRMTVADQNVADINASYYGVLDVGTAISFSQQIAWAVRRESEYLLDTVNYWITKMKKYNDYYAVYDKYFKSPRSFSIRLNSDFYGEKTGKISPYDNLIKKYAAMYNWDWRLISALVFQESRFDPEALSWSSANGLMQLMPATALELGVTNLHDPNENIRGGIKYLNQLREEWSGIEDSVQRLKFIFASYNCGINHVVDAQNLCRKYGMDPEKWDNHVEVQIKNLTYPKYYNDDVVKFGYVRGREPVAYVHEIFERYEHYKLFIPV